MGKYEWSEAYLLGQGYSKKQVDKYFHIDDAKINDIKNMLLQDITKGVPRERKCLTLFGQPGSGKSTYMRNNHLNDYIVIDIDDLRRLYPYREELIDIINQNHQNNADIPPENTKGRDFTNFTRKFVGILTDDLLNECIHQEYNIAWQKHASEYKALEATFNNLKAYGYEIQMVLVMVPAAVSWERCQRRNVLNDMVTNTVAKDFHDGYVAKIPQAIVDIIKHYIFDQPYVSKMDFVSETSDMITVTSDTDVDYDKLKEYVEGVLDLKND